MNHSIDALFFNHTLYEIRVAHVTFEERYRAPSDALHTRQRLPSAIAQIVNHDDIMPGLKKLDDRMGADVACAARY